MYSRLVGDTGIKYQTESNGAGIYTFPFVKPGPYGITVEKSDFRTLSRTGIKLDVSQNGRIDFTLEVGQTTQVVQVTASAPLVNTSDATRLASYQRETESWTSI